MNIVSKKAAHLIGSEIIRLGQEIGQRIKQGHEIFNLTIGDFDPQIFPIPEALKQGIASAYEAGETNYPPADGIGPLKRSVQRLLATRGHLDAADDALMIAGGGRPLIYAAYQTIVDPGDVVVYPTPSWNNNHYCYLSDARGIEVATKAENGFMPTAAEIAPHLEDAVLLALCSPLNPTGTTFREDQLTEICDLVLEENARRGSARKPLYVLYDQIYWMLRADGVAHVHPVSVRPEMRPFTIYIDGISKSLASTGLRIGWSVGPATVISKMKSILGHVGAWAPKAEQVATSTFLQDDPSLDQYVHDINAKLRSRFDAVYNGIQRLRNAGYPVQAIRPEGAIYVTAQFALLGRRKPDGTPITSTADITGYLLEHARLAVVPFTAFGCAEGTDWFRLSVGTLAEQDIPRLFEALESALQQLT